jgi:hypothetical protein
MDDCHLSKLEKMEKYILLPNHTEENKKLQFFKKWTYILHNKNNIVKYLMKTF